MSKLFIDDKAIEFVKKALEKENADAIRIFMSDGGCCKRFEIAFIKRPLAGDVTYIQNGIRVHIEKYLVDNSSTIKIEFDEHKGLLINLYE